MKTAELEIHPTDLAARLAAGEQLTIIDVRNGWEHDIGRIVGSVLIPLPTITARLDEIARDREVIVYCHHGTRSLMAAQFLQQNGYRVKSLYGGIDLWSQTVDAGVARY